MSKMKQTLKYLKSKYTLSETVFYQLDKIRPEKPIHTRFFTISTNGLMIIKEGYSYDGPSGPTIDTSSTMFASLIHDVLYECFRKELLREYWREEADRELAEIGKACGASAARMELWEWAVSNFAEMSSKPEARKVIYEVPAITCLGGKV